MTVCCNCLLERMLATAICVHSQSFAEPNLKHLPHTLSRCWRARTVPVPLLEVECSVVTCLSAYELGAAPLLREYIDVASGKCIGAKHPHPDSTQCLG